MTNEDEARLNKLFAIVAGHGTLREAREAAGLTLGQASRVLGWPRERIAALETTVVQVGTAQINTAVAVGAQTATAVADGIASAAHVTASVPAVV